MDVVAGFALREGLVLLGKRKAQGKRGGLWEMPGGKVDVGETHQQALAREWKEELGLEIIVGEHIATCTLDLEVSFTVDLYEVSFPEVMMPSPLDHDELTWGRISTFIEYMPCSPAMYIHYPQIREFLQRRNQVA